MFGRIAAPVRFGRWSAAAPTVKTISERQMNFRPPGFINNHSPRESENQFVVPPLGGSVECRPIPRRQTLPPKGGTTNCAFHSFRESQRDMLNSSGNPTSTRRFQFVGGLVPIHRSWIG